MPELHETMNIFADSKEDGAHPPMPAMSEVTKEPWLTHGYYHFGKVWNWHKFENMNLWFSWNETVGYYTTTDYSGYWFEPNLYAADSIENKFRQRLIDLRNVMVVGTSVSSQNYSTQTHWDIASLIAKADDFFVTQRDGIFEQFKKIDVPDSPMQGDGAAAFAAHLYKLGTYLESLTQQLDAFHNAVNDVRPGILSAIRTLAQQIDNWNANYKGIYDLVYDWYNTANANIRFNEPRDQMEVLVNPDTNDWGIVGDAPTDARVNALLHDRWRKQLDGVVDAAVELHEKMGTHYDSIAGRVPRILPIAGNQPPGYTPPGGEGGPGGPGGPGGDNPWNDPPDWLNEYLNTPPPKLEFGPPPDYQVPPPPGPGPGSGMPPPGGGNFQPPPMQSFSGPGAGSSMPPPPGSDYQPPPIESSGPGAGSSMPPPPGSDYQPPPIESSGPGAGSSMPPPGSFGGPGNSSVLPPPPDYSGPGAGSSMPPPGSFGGPGNSSVLPPPPDYSGPGAGSGITPPPGDGTIVPPPLYSGGPGGGSGMTPPPSTQRGSNRTPFPVDPDTGLPIDPDTGQPFPVDPDTGLPYDPDTGLPVAIDPDTGQPTPIDPMTGQPITSSGPGSGGFPGGFPTDPGTGLPLNPDTGQPFPVDPDTGLPYNPDTGLPIALDPDTGQPYPIDPITGGPVDPDTGLPIQFDPETGDPVGIDPITGQPITSSGPGSGGFPGGFPTDPGTGLPLNPDTGQPFPIDPDTGLPYNPDTGLPIALDPDTGQPYPIDPDTGLPYDPDTGLPIQMDPSTGQPVGIDPMTGEPITSSGPGVGNFPIDPDSGIPINPETGEPFPIDPETELPYNPDTGLPVLVDPDTGVPFPIDPNTGLPYDPDTGYQMAFDPDTGETYAVDPTTGLRIDPDTGQPITSSGPGSGSGLPSPPRIEIPEYRPSTTSGGPGSGGFGGDGQAPGTSDRSSMFAGPGGQNGAAGPTGGPGESGFLTAPNPGGPGQMQNGTGAPMGGMPPMMPPNMGGQNQQDRSRSTWLSEDERVWGTAGKDRKSVLGRPVPGEEKKGAAREYIDARTGGAGTRTSSDADGGVRAGKRKPGIGNRRGRVQGSGGEREG
ncbi:hypothetical protein ACQEU5_04270 [Marinactinospora thermotolerans]